MISITVITVGVFVLVLVSILGLRGCNRERQGLIVSTRNGNFSPSDKCDIYVRANKCFGFPHFPHVMEYFFFFTDIVLQSRGTVIVELPAMEYRSPYVDAFLSALKTKMDLKVLGKNDVKILPHTLVREFNHPGEVNLKLPYMLDGVEVNHWYQEWFKYPHTSNIMRDLLVQPSISQDKLTIGLVNRKLTSGRHLFNADAICGAIYNRFGLEVEQTFFENTTFDYIQGLETLPTHFAYLETGCGGKGGGGRERSRFDCGRPAGGCVSVCSERTRFFFEWYYNTT